MAKAKDEPTAAPTPEVHAVAQSLFQAVWRPNTGFDAWMTAVNCYRAAESFRVVAEKIAAGMSADDVVAEQQLLAEQRATAEANALAEEQAKADAKAKPVTP